MSPQVRSFIIWASVGFMLIVLCLLALKDAARQAHLILSPSSGAVTAQAEALVASVTKGQEHVVSSFAGPDGLVGVVVENAAKQRDVAWLSPNAGSVLVGRLLGPHGEDLTRDAKVQQGLLLSPAAALKAAAAPASHSFTVGTAGPILTVFFDANCVYCHQLYSDLTAAAAVGRVRVRYVLVGTLSSSSVPRAASLLGAVDPAKALAMNESNYDGRNEDGGFPIARNVDPALVATITANNELFAKTGAIGTPTALYCDKLGVARLQQGVPSDVAGLIASAGACK